MAPLQLTWAIVRALNSDKFVGDSALVCEKLSGLAINQEKINESLCIKVHHKYAYLEITECHDIIFFTIDTLLINPNYFWFITVSKENIPHLICNSRISPISL